MQKFEGKIVANGQKGCLSVLVFFFFLAVVIAIGFGLGSESLSYGSRYNEVSPEAIAIIAALIGVLVILPVTFVVLSQALKKILRFDVDVKNQFLTVYINKTKKFKSRNFKFKGDIRPVHNRHTSDVYFCLTIQDHRGVIHRFYEKIVGETKIDGVNIINQTGNEFIINLVACDPYPSFIFETWKALKGYRELYPLEWETKEGEEEFNPFEDESTNTTTLEEETNLKRWNELVDANSRSKMYNLPEFKSNSDYLALDEIEKNAFGDVSGKSLLHLQCHFGMSTLSFARMGADVTGVDFSDKAISLARSLSKELSIPANFVQSNIFDLKENLTGKFDYVFTSYGVLCWLKDIDKWGEIVSHFLRPGGTFFIVEFHPFGYLFDEESGEMKVKYKYFSDGSPQGYDDDRSYADGTVIKNTRSYEWVHTLGDIINSLIKAGLTIKEFKEYDYIGFNSHKFLKKVADREYRAEGDPIPLVFSIKATK